MHRALALVTLIACAADPDSSNTPPTPSDTGSSTAPPPTTPTAAQNVWYIDDEAHPGLYPSLNCQMSGDLLILNGADDGGVGTIQLILGERPLADATLAVNPAMPAPGEILVSIGRDREQDNQYTASSGEVDVQVVDTAPQAILVTFADLPSTTPAGAAALLSADVGAREGKFIGACDFGSL